MSDALTQMITQHVALAYLIVFLVSLGEALFLVGLVVPSTVVLVGAGALVGSGALPFWPVLALASAGAAVGDALSFWIGHHYRAGIRTIWPVRDYLPLVDRGERFFRDHGGKSILLGRFVPGVKAVIPAIAGMVGMNFAWFSVVNITSAVLWAGAHIVPAAGIGQGLSSLHAIDPRLTVLAGIGLLGAAATFLVVRFTYRRLGPTLSRRLSVRLDHLAASEAWTARMAHRFLTNDKGLAARAVLLLIAALAAAGFLTLLITLLFDPELTRIDQAVFNVLQSFRSYSGTRIVTAITMAADGLVLTVISVALVLWLAVRGHGRVALVAGGAIAAASLFVPVIKSFVQRARPAELYTGADAFSFPSGHATLSTTVFGIIAVLVAANVSARYRLLVVGSAAVACLLVAFSRLFLGAHWLSDVAAGLAFGTLVSAIFAILTWRLDRSVRLLPLAAVLLVAFGVGYSYHLQRSYAEWVEAYSPVPVAASMSQEEWISGGWRSIPMRRVTIGGDEAGFLLLQTDMALPALTERLAAMGWTPIGVGDLIGAMIPSDARLFDRPSTPLLHEGRRPVAAFMKHDADDTSRQVLNLWPIATLTTAAGPRELLVGGVVRERIDQTWGTYTTVDAEELQGNDAVNLALLDPSAQTPYQFMPLLWRDGS